MYKKTPPKVLDAKRGADWYYIISEYYFDSRSAIIKAL